MSKLFTLAFWIGVGWALLRTGLAALLPLLGLIFAAPTSGVVWVTVGLQIGTTLAVAVFTMLAGLPSTDAGPWWQLGLQRAVRQFGQYWIGALPAAAFVITQLDVAGISLAAAGSAAATFILTALTVIPPGSTTAVDQYQTSERSSSGSTSAG